MRGGWNGVLRILIPEKGAAVAPDIDEPRTIIMCRDKLRDPLPEVRYGARVSQPGGIERNQDDEFRNRLFGLLYELVLHRASVWLGLHQSIGIDVTSRREPVGIKQDLRLGAKNGDPLR